MDRMKIAHVFLAAFALLLSPIGNAQAVKVTVVPVESIGKFTVWLRDPIDPVRAVTAATYPGRLERLPIGKKVLLPVVVTGLPSPAAQEMRLVADMEILAPDGRSLGVSSRCCRGTLAQGSNSGAVLLDKWGIVQAEASDHRGNYTVRVSVTDGKQTWTATETLPYGEADAPGSANEIPRLRMNVPPSQLEPGGPGDKRDCLSLPTPSEVIKCSEKK